MSDLINEFWHITAEEDGIDNIAVALTTYFETLPDCPDGPINDETGWTDFAMDRFHNLEKRVEAHFQSLQAELERYQEVVGISERLAEYLDETGNYGYAEEIREALSKLTENLKGGKD